MSYKYDQEHTTLIIEQDKTADGVTPSVLIQMDHPLGPSSAIQVKPEDAPAVALAILEAAGIEASSLRADGNIKDPASRAVSCLHAWRVERAEQAEWEAEDDEARRYFEAICPGGVPWGVKNDGLRDAWLKQYRAARDFFRES